MSGKILKEPLKNPPLGFFETASEKGGFRYPLFSIVYSDRNRQHIPVLKNTLINQSFPESGSNRVMGERAIVRLLSCVVLAAALSAPLSALGAEWTKSIGASLRQVYTDNARLTDNDEDSEWTTAVTPGISLLGEGARLTLDFNYGVNLAYHTGADRSSSANHRMQATANAELADKWLFLDGRSTYTQTLIDQFRRSGGDTTSNSGNTENTFTWEVSPHTRHRLGGYATGATRLRYNEVRNSTSTDSRGVAVNTVLESGRYFPDLPWSLAYRYLKDFSWGTSGQSARRHIATGSVRYSFNRIWQVHGGVGREWNSFETNRSDDDGMRWDASVTWTPSERTQLRVGYSDRFYGSHPTLDFSHRGRRSIWTASYFKSLTNSRQLRLENDAYRTQDAFGDRIVDPVTGDLQEVTPDLGNSDGEIFVNQVFRMGYTFQSRRTTLSLNLRRSEKRYAETRRDSTTTLTRLTLTRALSGVTRATTDLRWERFSDDDNPELSEDIEHDTWTARLGLTHSLTQQTNVDLHYRFRYRDSDVRDDDYTENRISVFLTTSWQ